MTDRLVRVSGQIVDLHRQKPKFPHLSVVDYGATGDGVTDAQTSLATALTAAGTQNLPLYVPPGRYVHSGRLTLNGVVMFGLTPSATSLLGPTADVHAIDLRGTGSGLHNLTIRGPKKLPRTSDRGGNGVYAYGCTGYTVRNCVIRDVSGAGIMVEECTAGLVRNCDVATTGADGIFHLEGTHDVEIAYNRTYATGDDAIAVTSYDSAAGFAYDIDIHHNSVLGNYESRGITINGTSGGVLIHTNHVDGGTSGISTCSSSAFGTLQTSGVEANGNTIRNINQTRQDEGTIGGGALHLFNDTGGSDVGIGFHDNQVYNPGLHGIYITGTDPITASVVDNDFWMAAPLTLLENDNTDTTSITNTGNVRALPAAYSGDIVAATVGGLDPAYRFTPS